MEIPAPKFDRNQLVTLTCNSQIFNVYIDERWYNLHDNLWWYKLLGNPKNWFPETAFCQQNDQNAPVAPIHCLSNITY